MFYDAEAAVEEAVEQIEEAIESGEPIVIGPTSDIYAAAVEAAEAQVENETESEPVAAEETSEADAELMALIEEAITLSGSELVSPTEAASDPFAELLAELESQIAAPESEAVPAMFASPFEELLNQIMASDSSEAAPSREQVQELAEELAEEVVAEAVQNVEVANDPVNALDCHPEAEGSSQESSSQSMDATSKLALARRALVQARDTLTSVIDLLNDEMLERNGDEVQASEVLQRALHSVGARVMEGVFDGERMISGDGHMYPVPPNYASKSKLVEGDLLKLTMMPDGKMIYKQVGPTSRDRVKGVLSCDERGGYCVLADGARYKVIPASVSFFRGRPGDHVVALVPKGSPSKFAAVDFIVHQ